MARSPIPRGVAIIPAADREDDRTCDRHPARLDRATSRQPLIQAKTPGEQPDQGDGQEHQVVAQPAGLDRPAPVAGDVDGLADQVDQAVDGDPVEEALEPAQQLGQAPPSR